MARTKASVGAKVSAGKSSKARCSVAPPSSSSSSSGGEKSSRNYSGGNPVCPRETPKWQKPITNFFITNQTKPCDDGEIAGSSKSKPKRNIIHSDEESDTEKENKESKQDENVSKEVENESKEVENESKEDENEGKESMKSTENEAESQEYECSQNYEDSPPKNRELDESIVLEPLSGENSHKLEEYYTKDKGKGKGKKSKEDNNNRVSFKRQSEDIESPIPKKIRVN
ncbi:uncharacterized protein LOC123704751 [Colias croceus]|uniref:uncharacterized protein LOC123704751 n=1 Tax=Colias crocea TaxID=72248 RepID=UPI001E27DB35|nr:uncharacterized protein LOC123704751 [Colias croceus]